MAFVLQHNATMLYWNGRMEWSRSPRVFTSIKNLKMSVNRCIKDILWRQSDMYEPYPPFTHGAVFRHSFATYNGYTPSDEERQASREAFRAYEQACRVVRAKRDEYIARQDINTIMVDEFPQSINATIFTIENDTRFYPQ